jgi:hypothetical protein
MAVAFVQDIGSSTTDSGGTTHEITTTATATVGQHIVVGFGWFGAATTVSSVTDSAGNTYSVDIQGVNGMSIAVCSAPVTSQLTSGGTITITMNDSNADWQASRAATFSGIATASYVNSTDVEGFSDQNMATAATASTDDSVIVGACAMRDVTDRSFTPGTNHTQIATDLKGGSNNFAMQYRILTSASTFNSSGAWSGTDFQNSAAAHVIYKGAVGGQTPPYRNVTIA